jgi:endo-1,4-beta-xylanase
MCVAGVAGAQPPAGAAHAPAAATLRQAAPEGLQIGAAIMSAALDDPRLARLIATQFNSLTGENEFKPSSLQHEPGNFTFDRADRIVAFARQHDMKVIGHTLVWHHQSPRWMFQDQAGNPLPREQALANLRDHITTVLQHFKGKVHGWDVVNEAISDRGEEYLRDTPARRAIGDDYIEQAFRIAQQADPDVELYYNDYLIERPGKREKALRLIRNLKEKGVRIDGVGIQGHWSLDGSSLEDIEQAIVAFGQQGLKVMITELDIDVLPRRQRGSADLSATERQGLDPYKDALPPEVAQQQARRYAELFELFCKHRQTVTRVTLWGVHDGQSWLNNYPVQGRTNHPLLWDRRLQAKPAFEAVRGALALCAKSQ